MKKLILAVLIVSVLMIIGKSAAHAAEGTLSYEAASSSWNCHVMSISSAAPTQVIIGTTTASYMAADGYRRISWYSFTMWNENTSSCTYKMTPMEGTSADTAPTMSCSVDAPLGLGAVGSPVAVTEQVIGMKIWMLYCGDSTAVNVKIGQRGR